MSFHSQRFGRAAQTYDAHAEVQSQMADTLITLLPDSAELGLESKWTVLEMGCGTGLLTKRLRTSLPDADLQVTDASQSMLNEVKSRGLEHKIGAGSLHFSVFDASGKGESDALTVLPEIQNHAPYTLAASNALVQWFPNLDAHFQLVSNLLIPGGVYLVSGFSRDNFPELNALLAEPPFNYQEFPGHHRAEIEKAAEASEFKLDFFAETAQESIFPTPEAFLAVISGLGSSRRPSQRPLTKSRLVHLVDRYRARYACLGGIKATWKPWYARLSRLH